jgi:hypothetical protein
MADPTNPADDMTLVIRQPKDDPDAWNVAAQVGSPIRDAEIAKGLARSENKAFGVHTGGDVAGTDFTYTLMTKGELRLAYEDDADTTT